MIWTDTDSQRLGPAIFESGGADPGEIVFLTCHSLGSIEVAQVAHALVNTKGLVFQHVVKSSMPTGW